MASLSPSNASRRHRRSADPPRQQRLIHFALFILLALASCAATPPRALPSCRSALHERRACDKEWTVLVYMAADNADLPPYAYLHLHEMEAAWDDPDLSSASTPDADVLVELDLLEPAGIRRLHMRRAEIPYAPTPWLDENTRLSPELIRSPVVMELPEETLSKQESLQSFLEWGIRNYPSKHYFVVVWGHGLGYRPADLPEAKDLRYDPRKITGGIAFDENPPSVLDTPALRAALEGASDTLRGGRPFDIYASDACLMQSLEVTTALEHAARYLVGSEQIEDYLGLPYRTFLPYLNGTRALPRASARCAETELACRLAALLPLTTREAFLPGGLYAELSPRARETFTLSTLDAALLERELHPAMARLSSAYVAYLREDPWRTIDLRVLLGQDRSIGLAGPAVPSFWGSMRDTGIFLERANAMLQGSPAPTEAARALEQRLASARRALDATVLASAFGSRYHAPDYVGMGGLSLWLPHSPEEYAARVDFFASSPFYDLPRGPAPMMRWGRFLGAVFARQ